MTGYTVLTGSTEKFAEGFDKIFGSAGKTPAKKAAKKATKPNATKKAKKPKK